MQGMNMKTGKSANVILSNINGLMKIGKPRLINVYKALSGGRGSGGMGGMGGM